MAADTRYEVVADLTLGNAGSATAGLMGAARAADSLASAAGSATKGAISLASGLSSMVARAVTTTAAVGAVGAALGGAFVGKMAHTIGANEAMLEGKGIQLAAVMAAATSTPFDQARKASDTLFQQFRKDAVTSAGETADFIDIASGLTGPLLGAGHSMAELREMTKGVMSAAPAMGVSFQQAGSDVMRMLQGVAGVEQPLFRAMVAIPDLGIKKAEEFNKLGVEERIKKVQQALATPAFKAAADAYGASWSGLTSTLADQAKTMGGLVAGPVFATAKRGLQSVTTGLGQLIESGPFRVSLERMGDRLGLRFSQIGTQFQRMFPDAMGSAQGFMSFVERATDRGMAGLVTASVYLADHWVGIKTGAREVAHWVERAADSAGAFVKALGGGDMATGMQRLAAGLAVNQAAQAVLPDTGTMLAGVGAVGSLGRLAGMGGGGAAATGAAGAAAGAEAPAGLAALGALQMIFINLLPLLLPVLPMIEAFGTNVNGLGDRLSATWHDIEAASSGVWASLGKVWDAMGRAYDAARPFIAILGDPFLRALNDVGQAAAFLLGNFGGLADGMVRFFDKVAEKFNILAKLIGIEGLGSTHEEWGKSINKEGPFDPKAMHEDVYGGAKGLWADPTLAGAPGLFGKAAGADKKKGGGGGSKVEVVIKWDLGDGNEDALYVKTRKDIEASLSKARSYPRMVPMRG